MNKNIIAALSFMVIAISMYSCAQSDNGEDTVKKLSRKSFDSWISINAPDAEPLKDIYIEYIERGDPAADQPVLGNTYVRIDYTGRTLDGYVFVTRTDSISRLLGKFRYNTHYVPGFTAFRSDNPKVCPGLRTALDHMRTGDSVRIYIPTDQAYNQGGEFDGADGAYRGQTFTGASYMSRPVIMEVRLNQVVYDPYTWEREWVEKYASREWGLVKADTLGLFMRIIEANPEGDPLKDSSAMIYFEQYFPDGFLVSTNIDTVAKKHNVFVDNEEDTYNPIVVSTTVGENYTEQKIYPIVVERMRKGETAEVIVMSLWTYGNEGKPANNPEISPYQPLRYIIKTQDKSVSEDEK